MKEGSLRSLGNYESYGNYGITDKSLCVAIVFFGFRGYHRRWYKEKRDMGLSNLFEQNISLFYL